MKQTTLCFLIKDESVLLAMKKRGFGIGKWNGVGGKVLEGEDIATAAIRETQEEIGVTIALRDLEPCGTLEFAFKDNPDWAQESSVFICRSWNGEPTESEEMNPRWYNNDAIPFDKMWVDDPHWLPLVLAGKKIHGTFLFEKDGSSIIEYKITEL